MKTFKEWVQIKETTELEPWQLPPHRQPESSYFQNAVKVLVRKENNPSWGGMQSSKEYIVQFTYDDKIRIFSTDGKELAMVMSNGMPARGSKLNTSDIDEIKSQAIKKINNTGNVAVDGWRDRLK